MNAPERNAPDNPLPGSVSDQNAEEQPGGHDDKADQHGPGTPHERGDDGDSGGESGEGSQSTGNPGAAG
jgi:hypothetical protein